MKKIIFSTILCLCFAISTISAQTYSGGSGTEQDPYLISSKADMATLASAVNGGNNYSDKYFLLAQDLTGITTVIGTTDSNPSIYNFYNYFMGTFDGGGHSIGLSVNMAYFRYKGVFGSIKNATIKNLGVTGSITGESSHFGARVGGICGEAYTSSITNCYSKVSISSTFSFDFSDRVGYFGGICGEAYSSSISNCYNEGSILVTSNTGFIDAGGICGFAIHGSIINSHNKGSVAAISNSCGCVAIGGICGFARSVPIRNCYNIATIQETTTNCSTYQNMIYAGGICGYVDWLSTINYCYNTGNISVSVNSFNAFSGGICGALYNVYELDGSASSPQVSNCIAANTSISGTLDANSRKIVGYVENGGTIENCHGLSSMQINTAIINSQDATSRDGKDLSLPVLQFFIDNWDIISNKRSVCSHTTTDIIVITGNPIKWQRSSDNGNSWTNIACTSNTYTEVDPSAGHFIYRAQNSDGSFSNNAEITYNYAIQNTINILPISSSTKTVDESITFSLDLTDDNYNYNYQWYKGNRTIDGATNSTYKIDSLKCSDAGTYKCLVYNACNSAYSEIYTLVVNKSPQVINFPEIPIKTYGNDVTITLPLKTDKGLNITYQSSNTNVATVLENSLILNNPGTSNIIALQIGNEDYLPATTVERTLTIKANQTITFDALPNKWYGDPTFILDATTTSGLSVEYESSNPSVATVSGNVVTIVGAGTTDITSLQVGNEAYFPSTSKTQTLIVNKADLTITADDKTRTFGETNPAWTLSYSGFVNNDTESVLDELPRIVCDANEYSLGTYYIYLFGGFDNNYNFTLFNGQLKITQLKQVISLPEFTPQTYGDVLYIELPIFTDKGFWISYESSNTQVATIEGYYLCIVGAGTSDIVASESGGGLYFPAESVTQTLTVNKAPLTIKANNATRKQGESNPTFTLSHSGFKNNENESVLDVLPTITCLADATSPVGLYDIILSGGSDNNYEFNFVHGKLEVVQGTGINDAKIQNITVYPNPAQATATIKNASGKTIRIFNPLGIKVYEKEMPSDEEQISVSGWTSGIYIVKIFDKEKILDTMKLLKN
jgi:hypothetical protein